MTRIYVTSPAKTWIPANAATSGGGGGGGGGDPTGVIFGVNMNNPKGAPNSPTATRLAQYGRVPMGRIYYSGVLPNAIGTKEKNASPEKRWQVSFKANANDLATGVLDNTIVSYANSVAAWSSTAEAHITFHHEPNGDFNSTDFTLADYKAGYIRMSQLLWSLPTKNMVRPMLNYSAPKGDGTQGASWSNSWMIPFSDFANPKATISWDSYGNPSGQGCTALACPYTTPDYTFNQVVSLSQFGGWWFDGGWGITETNAPLRNTTVDPTGSLRTQWFTDAIDYLLSQAKRPHHIFLWEGNGNQWDQNINVASQRLPWRTRFLASA